MGNLHRPFHRCPCSAGTCIRESPTHSPGKGNRKKRAGVTVPTIRTDDLANRFITARSGTPTMLACWLGPQPHPTSCPMQSPKVPRYGPGHSRGLLQSWRLGERVASWHTGQLTLPASSCGLNDVSPVCVPFFRFSSQRDALSSWIRLLLPPPLQDASAGCCDDDGGCSRGCHAHEHHCLRDRRLQAPGPEKA